MPPTIFSDLARITVERLHDGVNGNRVAEVPVAAHVEDLVRSAGAVLGILENGWLAAESSLKKGVEKRQFVLSLRSIQSPLANYLETCEAIRHEAAACPGPGGAARLAELDDYRRRAEAILSEATPLLEWAERTLPPLDEADLLGRQRRAEEANSWVDFDDVLAELKASSD